MLSDEPGVSDADAAGFLHEPEHSLADHDLHLARRSFGAVNFDLRALAQGGDPLLVMLRLGGFEVLDDDLSADFFAVGIHPLVVAGNSEGMGVERVLAQGGAVESFLTLFADHGKSW